MIVISDIHGELSTLEKLIDILPKDRQIAILGDAIDRGPNSKEVVEYILDNNFIYLKGNHEAMAVDAFFEKSIRYDSRTELWKQNGGYSTLSSYKGQDDVFSSHINMFKNLPLTYEYTNIHGLEFILSHSCITSVWDLPKTSPDFELHCLWVRKDDMVFDSNKIGKAINVIGHTPVEEVSRIGNVQFIDRGCTYKVDYLGRLAALDLDTGIIYEVSRG